MQRGVDGFRWMVTSIKHQYASSVRLRDLPALAQARLRVLVLLPADGVHGIARLARRHDNTQLIARRREVVVGLVAERDLSQNEKNAISQPTDSRSAWPGP